jgi:hypothetical protein
MDTFWEQAVCARAGDEGRRRDDEFVEDAADPDDRAGTRPRDAGHVPFGVPVSDWFNPSIAHHILCRSKAVLKC